MITLHMQCVKKASAFGGPSARFSHEFSTGRDPGRLGGATNVPKTVNVLNTSVNPTPQPHFHREAQVEPTDTTWEPQAFPELGPPLSGQDSPTAVSSLMTNV